ncbi:hypothetical protein O181_021220 [Austropuccinia psidii MF-1]|uniref:Uncharacterized protein n=1 Tax=Austropuccinia psidii MF-1 TaxID=1389203 RepID=A0A9Q3CE83_9BASI|nr:hypothetical protein [Austropuccinia psidii MF-1]
MRTSPFGRTALSFGFFLLPLFCRGSHSARNQTANVTLDASFVVVEEYAFGIQGVWVQHREPTNCTQSPEKPRTRDITPAQCNRTCFPGSFQPPRLSDCNKIIESLLNNNTGSLQANPHTWVYVYYESCVAVFENPDEDSPTLQYNWAVLGANVKSLVNSCLSTPDQNSIGGACVFDEYDGKQLSNVEVAVQRFTDFDDDHDDDE